jgi:UDP-glucose-4-epimerase GalE
MSARDVILVTGGAGYVGAHFARAAIDAGSRVVVIDDLSGAADWPVLPRTECILADVGDRAVVREVIERRQVTAVVHFAGRTCVEASIADPATYFEHNVSRTIALLDVVREVGPRVVVLSSSAAVYGEPRTSPIVEGARYAPVSPYGATKLAAEHALASYGRAYGVGWAALRYFNAAGAHPDGTLREHHDPETHLIPLAIDAALGRRPPLRVFGDDYPTRDGTCTRDYVHVCDLADAHLAAIDAIGRGGEVGAVNLGSGTERTVREVLQGVTRVVGHDVPHEVVARRSGDPGSLVASRQLAKQLLGWRPTRSDLDVIVEDALRSRRDH